MRFIVFLVCLLSIASAQQYFALRVQDGRAIALGNGGTHAYLKLVPYNVADQSQFWYLESAGSVGPGSFVVSRAFPALNFDINGGSIVAGSRLTGWERKSGTTATRNQRFLFDASSGFLVPAVNTNLFVTATPAGIVQLATKTPESVGLSLSYDLPFYARITYSTGSCSLAGTSHHEYYLMDYCLPYNSSHYLLSKLDAVTPNAINFEFFTNSDCSAASSVYIWQFLTAGACNTDNPFYPGKYATGARAIGISLNPPAGSINAVYFLGTCSRNIITNPVKVSFYPSNRCNPESAWIGPDGSSLSFTGVCDAAIATKSSFATASCTGTATDTQFDIGTCHSVPSHPSWVAKIGCGRVQIQA